jgi:hypothetical protein
MLEGTFAKKKVVSLPLFMLMAGVLEIGLFIYTILFQPQIMWKGYLYGIFGLAAFLGGLFAFLLNRNAYFRLEDGYIHAKYHVFGKLHCALEDVVFVQAQLNSLTILLKSGKSHNIMGLTNSYALGASLRKLIYTPETESREVLREQFDKLSARRRREMFFLIGCIVLMFAVIFATVILTESRELSEFTQQDHVIFFWMGIVEAITVISMFILAKRSGARMLPIFHLRYRLCGATIRSQPLPSGNVQSVYTDENNSGRIVICGFPNEPDIYYCLQEFAPGFELTTTFTSEVFPREEDLPFRKEEVLIDISSCFLT